MERILVGMDIRETSLGAVYRAIHLAMRIKAPVFILLVSNAEANSSGNEISKALEGSVRKRLELMIEMGRSQGVNVNYYVTQGDFEEEVIRFVEEKNVTLLVLGLAEDGSKTKTGLEFRKTLSNIRKRVNCSIELVHQKESSHLEGEGEPSGPKSK
jgi:nucleotide-binding universal stress UspA family protein